MKIGLMLTSSCNFQCRHCMVDSIRQESIADRSVIERFYEIVRWNQPDMVCIVGGEPFLYLDVIEEIVGNLREICHHFLIYSNGTFLLDEKKRERIKNLGVQVRISKTKFHKDFWNEEIEQLINRSPYWKVDLMADDIRIFPRGRALSNNVYQDQICPCSLITQEYHGKWHSDRFLVMQDGSVNIWCPCMSLELANVFKDSIITHDLLVEREKHLRGYLSSVNMIHDRLEQAIIETGARLIILDLIQAYIGATVDMHRANEIRPVLKHLGIIAEKHNCAIILIGHMNKASGSKSTYRGLGSIDIQATARSVLLVARLRDKPNIRIMAHDKSSLASAGDAIGFEMTEDNGMVCIAFVILLKCNKGVFFISGKNGRYMLKFILVFYMKKQI